MERRLKFRAQLSTTYLPYYDALCALLPVEWQPYSGMRDFDAQDQLYALGRTRGMIGPGYIVTHAKGGESPHNYGCATDWTVFEAGKPVWMLREDPRWKIYMDTVVVAGLRSGAEFGDVDHNELRLDCDWKHILLAYQAGNMTRAQDKIVESLSK